MYANNTRGPIGQSASHVTRNVSILVVDEETESLMFLASQFEEQSYKVCTTESAKVALSILGKKKSKYDAIIVDRHMLEMNIYEFIHEIHRQQMNIPIMIMDHNKTVESVREAMVHHKVCYVFSKPLSHLDIASFWQHIPRVAIKSKSKKSRMRWTPELQEKFVYAVERLGEDARPSMILETMKEPDLKYGHVASHLQKYRNGSKNSVNLLKSSWTSSCMESQGAPPIQMSPDWPQTPNSIMDNRGVHVPKGGVARGIGQNLSSGLQTPNHELAGATDHVIPSRDLLGNNLSAVNHELAGAASEAVNPVSNNHNIGEGSTADQPLDVDSFMDIDGFMEKLDKQTLET